MRFRSAAMAFQSGGYSSMGAVASVYFGRNNDDCMPVCLQKSKKSAILKSLSILLCS
jgi:hypothetical protein